MSFCVVMMVGLCERFEDQRDILLWIMLRSFEIVMLEAEDVSRARIFYVSFVATEVRYVRWFFSGGDCRGGVLVGYWKQGCWMFLDGVGGDGVW